MAVILGVAPPSSRSVKKPDTAKSGDEKSSESKESEPVTSNGDLTVAKESVQDYFAKKMAEMNVKLGSRNGLRKKEKDESLEDHRPSFGLGLGHGSGLGFTTENQDSQAEEKSIDVLAEITKEDTQRKKSKKDKKKSKKRELAESSPIGEKKAKKSKKSKKEDK